MRLWSGVPLRIADASVPLEPSDLLINFRTFRTPEIMDAFNLDDERAALESFWDQKTLGTANGTVIKVAKGKGSTTWHRHDDQDEVFFVRSGTLIIEDRAGVTRLGPGDLLIVPRGTEHRTSADPEASFLLLGTSVTSTREGGKPEWSFDAPDDPAST